MSSYEPYCWQIYRLDYPRLGPVKEHRGDVLQPEQAKEDKDWLYLLSIEFLLLSK